MFSALIAAATILMQAAPAADPAPVASVAPASPEKTVSPVTVTPTPSISKRREVDPTLVVCHDELPIGSRFAKKVCASNGEFAERTRLSREQVREWQRAVISTSHQ